MRFQKEREALVRYGALLYERGLVKGTSGNVSLRSHGTVLITPSGSCKGHLAPEDLLEVDLETGSVQGMGRSSIETPFHLALYRHRQEVGAVVHCHPLYGTILAVAGIPLRTDLTPEGLLVLGVDVPLVPYETPGTKELAEQLHKGMGTAKACLLERHGALTVGKDLKEAFHRMESLEFNAELQYRLMALGKERALPEKEVRRILEGEHGRK